MVHDDSNRYDPELVFRRQRFQQQASNAWRRLSLGTVQLGPSDGADHLLQRLGLDVIAELFILYIGNGRHSNSNRSKGNERDY